MEDKWRRRSSNSDSVNLVPSVQISGLCENWLQPVEIIAKVLMRKTVLAVALAGVAIIVLRGITGYYYDTHTGSRAEY